MKKAIKRIAMLFMVCGLAVSVSFAYELTEMTKGEVEGVKKIVEELELLDKNELLGYQGKRTLKEGRLFLEFVEKVKQSKEKKCIYAVGDVMGDDDNEERYRYGRYGYRWNDTRPVNFYCLDTSGIVDGFKKTKEEMDYNKALRDAIIRQKANVMKSGDGALLKDGVTEVGTLSDGTKIEIEKKIGANSLLSALCFKREADLDCFGDSLNRLAMTNPSHAVIARFVCELCKSVGFSWQSILFNSWIASGYNPHNDEIII